MMINEKMVVCHLQPQVPSEAEVGDLSVYMGAPSPTSTGMPLPHPTLPVFGSHSFSAAVGPPTTWLVAMSYPFGELGVHHEIMHVLLGFGELQLPGHHSHHECSAACSLQGGGQQGDMETVCHKGVLLTQKLERAPRHSAAREI